MSDLLGDPDLRNIYGDDYYEFAQTERCAQCSGFWKELWPRFLKEIDPLNPGDQQ